MSARPSNWALRSAPRGVLPYYLATECAVVAVIAIWPGHTPTGEDWLRLLTLLGLGVLQAELSRQTERIRRYFAGIPHINMTSVWIFAGALLLPSLLAVLLAVLIYVHLWIRVWRPIKNRPMYRVLFSGATMALSCLGASPVMQAFGTGDVYTSGLPGSRGLPLIVAAGLAFTAVNALLVAVGVKLHGPHRKWRTLFGTWTDNALELATLCLGGVTAALFAADPALVALMMLPVIVLHRGVLMRQLEEMAVQDSKTGLLTDAEWTNRATSELARAARGRESFGVLFIDLDRFKRINDTYGHLVGDEVLRAVAEQIRTTVRPYDSVGRWGGEEYAVLLPRLPESEALAVAERIRSDIEKLVVTVTIEENPLVISDLSVSIGLASFPDNGTTIEVLVQAADEAMYAAKRNGRNQVVTVA